MKFIQLTLICLLFSGFVNGQIKLNNASFEGEPKDAKTPNGWDPCGTSTTPDILPGFWGVENKPENGKTFLGLITRQNETWEYIGQKLSNPLKKGECYMFSASLAKSPNYALYNRSIILKIWGGESSCVKKQLLAQTDLIDHYDWKQYDFVLIPKGEYNYIILEAYYGKDTIWPYNGNFLLDNCSAIELCNRVSLDNVIKEENN